MADARRREPCSSWQSAPGLRASPGSRSDRPWREVTGRRASPARTSPRPTGLDFRGDYGAVFGDPGAEGYLMQQNMGNGAAVGDYDGDG